MIKSISFKSINFSIAMNLKFEGNQVTYFFKLNQQYFFYSAVVVLIFILT